MHELYLNSMRDTLLVAIPFIAVLALGVFRLDAIFFSSKSAPKQGRTGCGMDERGEPVLVDPDGRPCEPTRKRR
jgi:hypothetical protein